MRRLLLFLLAGSLIVGCAERPAETDETGVSFTVRGLYIGTAYDSAAAVVSHEAIPGFMDAMRMPLRVDDPALLRGLSEGDKIRFHLADRGEGYRIDHIDLLPPDTPLVLAEYGADAVPPEASLPDSSGLE